MGTTNDDSFFISKKDLKIKEKSVEVVATLTKEQQDEALYNAIMAKPLMTGHDVLNFPAEPNDYLVEKMLWKNSVSMFIGPEKSCKSIFTSQKGIAMTYGDNFLGYDVVKPLNVFYIQCESDMAETKQRFTRFTKKGGVKWNPDKWRHYNPPAVCLDIDGKLLDSDTGEEIYAQGSYNDICWRIDKDGFNPDVIIIDPLYMAMEGSIVDEYAVRKFIRNVRRLKDRFKCAIIVVHHEKKPTLDKNGNAFEQGDNSIFGSSMLKNFASHVLQISIIDEHKRKMSAAKEKDSSIKYRKVSCATQRSGNVVKDIYLELSQNPLLFKTMDTCSSSSSKALVLKAIKFRGQASAVDIINDSSMGESTIRKCFGTLKAEGLIKVAGSGENGSVLYEVIEVQQVIEEAR